MKAAAKSAPLFGIAKDKVRYYKGLRQMTDLYVHDKVLEILKLTGINFSDKSVRVLDLGCGQGALSYRLHDEGATVVAVDADAENFRAEGPSFKAVDFNNPRAVDAFVNADGGTFDIIVASEVIEHLRNPWDLLNTIGRLSHEETEVIITTPNVSSWWSRFWFFMTGELWGFGRNAWSDPGHINPITHERFLGVADDCDFLVCGVHSAGVLPIIWAYNWKRLIASLVCFPFRLVQRGNKDGWVVIYRIKKII